VDVALGITAALGTCLTAAPFWHEIVRITREHAGPGGAPSWRGRHRTTGAAAGGPAFCRTRMPGSP